MGPLQAEVRVMKEDSVLTACPSCKRLVQAKDYLRHPLGSVMPNIICPCGYRGFPIQLTLEEYIAWTNGKDLDDIDEDEGAKEEN